MCEMRLIQFTAAFKQESHQSLLASPLMVFFFMESDRYRSSTEGAVHKASRGALRKQSVYSIFDTLLLILS